MRLPTTPPRLMVGASAGTAGASGYAPAPAAGQQGYFLTGDGTWSLGLPLDVKASVRATTTANITLSGAQTIDGVAVIAGDRVLVKNQTTDANNGIYVAAAGAWARSTDANTSALVTSGMFTFVSEGTVGAGNGYVLTTADPITLGTTSLAFTQFSGAGEIVAGTNISKSGNTLSTTSTLTSINSIASAATNTLILGTGTFGTAVTFASATGIPTFATAIYGASGTAGAPGWSFSGDPDSGVYSYGANILGVTTGGTATFAIGGGAAGYIQGGTSLGGAILQWAAAGAFAIQAQGTNQSITLTPTGTGGVTASFSDSTAGSNNYIKTLQAGTGETGLAITRTAGSTLAALIYAPQGSNQLRIFNSVDVISFANNGNVLLGGTTNGTGQLQLLSAAGTSAGGITFATDINLFRSGANALQLTGASAGITLSGTPLILRAQQSDTAGTTPVMQDGNGYWNIRTTSTGNKLAIDTYSGSAMTNAILIDSSQNATFAGNVTLTAGDVLPGTDNNHNIGSASKRWSQLVLGSGASSTVGTFSFQKSALGTTSTDSVDITNTTAATGGTTVQISPRLRLRGTAWDTAASQTVDFFVENLPTSAATPSGTLKWGYSLNGAAATYPMTLTSGGTLTTSIITATGGIIDTSGATGAYRINANAVLSGVGGNLSLNAGAGFTNVLIGSGSLLPATDNAVNLGSSGAKWSSLYVGTGTASFGTTISTYNNIATAGNGVASIQGAGRATAQTAANSSIATYTVGASDASFIISANVLVTTATAHSFSIECAYTDEGSTARTVTFNVQQLGGTLVTAITNVTGAGPYEGVPLHIRAKASTSITIRTNSGGTYTTVTYNAEGVIQKIA